MVLDVLRKQDGLTASERLVAEYILSHPDELGALTVAQLATRALTSKGTVMRLCRKTECTRFSQFKQVFAVEWRDWSRMQQMLSREPFEAGSSIEDVVAGTASIYERVLAQAALELDRAQVERVVGRLAQADAIRLHGTGVSLALASIAAFKFEALGFEAVAVDGVNEHYLQHVTRDERRLCALFLSFTGGNVAMAYAARNLRSKGIYTVGIGQSNKSALAEACDEYFDLGSELPVLTMEAVEITVLINYVLDVLITPLMVRDYNLQLSRAIQVLHHEHPEVVSS